MACTFTALILRGRQAHVLHVGDTRLYRLRDGVLDRLSTDHALAASGLRHVLTRAVGTPDTLLVDHASEPARVHDRYLLCSDGIHGVLSDATIRATLAERAAPEETARVLVEQALASRTGDNATALVVDVVDLPEPEQADLALAIDAQPILPAPKAGASVDGFALLRVIADGRYSRVFEADDTQSGCRVILKFPKPIEGGDAMLRQAFLREAWIAARLRSPFVCEVIELPPGRASRLYTVMPLYVGETLEQRLRRDPPVTLPEGLRIGEQLARAVSALHRAGVVHRDIKPDNVMLERDGGLRLLDLGVARLPGFDDFPSADRPGTPSYMAPELIGGAQGDERSDLFALGVTLYRAFARAYPYGEIEPFSRPRFGRATPLLMHRPDLPAWLEPVLARATAVDPADRFAHPIELLFALEHGERLAKGRPRPLRLPLYERDKLRFWQTVSALLALALLAECALGS